MSNTKGEIDGIYEHFKVFKVFLNAPNIQMQD